MTANGYRFSYTINGGTNVLIDNVNTFLKRGGMRGFGMRRVQIPAVRVPGMDGARVIGTVPTVGYMTSMQQMVPQPIPYSAPREMSLAIEIEDDDLAEWVETNRTMVHNCTPYEVAQATMPGRLLITTPDNGEYGGTVYEIECWCVEWSDGELRGLGGGTVVATFWAPNPFFHLAYGEENSTLWGGNPQTITNPGDAPIWPSIEIQGSASTTVVGLHLTNNTTGKIWSTSQTMAVGATKFIRVNMLTGEAWYTTDNWATWASLLSKIDTDAEFWEMPVGANELEWSSTSGTPTGLLTLHAWNYLAV